MTKTHKNPSTNLIPIIPINLVGISINSFSLSYIIVILSIKL